MPNTALAQTTPTVTPALRPVPTGRVAAAACADWVDAAATRMCQAWQQGLMTEAAVRDEITSMLMPMRLDRGVAVGYGGPGGRRYRPQVVDDLAEGLYRLVTDKCLHGGSASSVDLDRVAGGASVTGWARQLMTTAVGFLDRERQREERRNRVAQPGLDLFTVLPGGDPHVPLGWVSVDATARLDEVEATAAGMASRVTFEDGLDEFEVAARLRRRGCPALVHAVSRALATAYVVPRPGVLACQARRARLAGRLDQCPTYARTQLVMLADALEHGDPDGVGDRLDVDVLEVARVSAWTPENLRTLGRDPRVADAMVRAAATPRSPRPRAVQRALARQVTATVEARLGRRSRLGFTLVRAWQQASSEMDGHEWDTSRTPQPKTPQRQQADRDEFARVAARLLALQVCDYGHTVDAVEASLQVLADRVERELAHGSGKLL